MKSNVKFSEGDHIWMREALKEAHKAFGRGEVPVGAVVVSQGELIARAHNEVECRQDPTAHAEKLALQQAARHRRNWRLVDAVLYTTLEPCAMCAGAAFLARIARIVWGADDFRHGAGGSWVDLFSTDHPIHSMSVDQGLFAKEAGALMTMFFRNQRKEKGWTRKVRGNCSTS